MSEHFYVNKAGTKFKVTDYQSNGDGRRTPQAEVKGESVPSLRTPTILRTSSRIGTRMRQLPRYQYCRWVYHQRKGQSKFAKVNNLTNWNYWYQSKATRNTTLIEITTRVRFSLSVKCQVPSLNHNSQASYNTKPKQQKLSFKLQIKVRKLSATKEWMKCSCNFKCQCKFKSVHQ